MMIRTVGKKNKNGEAGSALVEFALATVIVLTVVFGIIDMGRAAYAYHWVSNAARLGTRFAMVRGSYCSGLSGGCPAQQSDIQAYVISQGAGVGIDTSPGVLTVSARCVYGVNVPSLPPCPAPNAVQVTVNYQFSFVSPFAPHTWTMTSRSQRVVAQ
jgi:Flp pilus assembly protein TadG